MKICIFIFITATSFLSISQTVVMNAAVNNTTVSTCSAVLFDSGGMGGAGYSDNESTVITFCPATPGDYISLAFNLFSLNTTDDNPSPTQTNLDYISIYDGNSTSANTLGTYSGNDLAGSIVMATNLNLTGCITIKFTSNTVGTGAFSASVSCNTPCSDPVANGIVVGGITNDSIRVCVGELVSFQEQGSIAQPGFNIASYKWDFMDNTTATTQNATHSFSVPGLYNVQLFVTDDNPDNVCVNNNLISLQVLVGTIPDFTGFPGDTALCIGESVTFSADPNSYEVLWDGFPSNASIADGCLTDNSIGVAQTIDLLQTGFVTGSTITNVNQIQSICIELEHSFMGDLVIQLSCPNGQSIILHQQGGSGTQIGIPNQLDNVDCSDPSTQGVPFNYCFTPTATDTWVSWVAAQTGFSLTLPAGNYLPIDPMSNLIGCPTNGVWSISVTDNWGADDGTLFSFGLDLDPIFYPTIISFTPQIGVGPTESFWSNTGSFITNLDPNKDVITITPTAAGLYNYLYTVTDDFGCTFDTSVNVVVASNPVLNAGNDTTICNGAQFQLTGQIVGAIAGCNYSLVLDDTFGDGWNGNTITINNGGVSTDFTLATGLTQTFPLPVVSGVNIIATFNAIGSFISEASFTILDASGNVVVTQGPNLAAGTVDNFIALCSPAYVFGWTPANQVSDATIADPMLQLTAPQTLTFSAYPPGHPACVVTDQIVIGFSVNPNAGTDGALTICTNAAPVDLFTLLGGGPVTGGTWVNSLNAPVVMPYNPITMNPGTYTYVLNNGGCTDSADVVVQEINTIITNSQVVDVNCFGANNGSVTITGTNITSYKVNSGVSVVSGSPFTINALAPGAYFIEVFGPAGCQDDITVNIVEPLPLQITSLTDDTTICLGQSVPLVAMATGGNGAYIYTWVENLNPIGVGSPFTVTPLATTQYCVVVSEACGSAPATECMDVSMAAPIVNTLTQDKINGCYPVTINFTNTTVTPDFKTVRVDFGDGTSSVFNTICPFSHTYTTGGLFTVTMTTTSNFGCDYVTVFSNLIEGFSSPDAGFTINPQKVSMFNPKVNLSSTSSADVTTYLWDIPSGNPSSSNLSDLSSTYPLDSVKDYIVTLYVTNIHGCTDSITNYVQVHEEVLLYAPNTFTPDGDSFNETWKVFAVGLDPERFNLKLFNRWGELIFETNDLTYGWKADYKGEDVPDGTYNWMVSAGNKYDDNKYVYRGFVNVIR